MSGTTQPGSTLLLDLDGWDLCLDAKGDIALATAPYSAAQDAASAIRTFLGEVYYDTTVGVPYFQDVLGHTPPLALLKAQITAAALTVPGIVSAQCFISGVSGRTVTGQIQVTDSTGTTTAAAF